MLDLVRKVLYTGIGFAALTEQKAEELVGELEKQGEVSSEEGKQLAQDLLDKAKQQRQELEKTIQTETEKVVQKLGMVSRSEFEELKQRIERLEAMSCPPCADEESL